MPRAVQYRAGSIVFFAGDNSKNIYVLKQGQISLTYKDIHDGQEIVEYVKHGEFFGVKATLGRLPHDETATVLDNSIVIQFTIREFEALMSEKPHMIIKMLGVYSKQLRVIHNEVQNLLTSYKVLFPEEGLVKVGEYYLKNKNYKQALYAFNKYNFHYPQGAYHDIVAERIHSIPHNYDQGIEPPIMPSAQPRVSHTSSSQAVSEGSLFAETLNQYNRSQFEQALTGFLTVIKQQDQGNMVQADFRVGCCLFHLEKPSDAIRHFTNVLKKYPKHPDIGEILFYLGQSYKELSIEDKAMAFYKKAQSMIPQETPLFFKVEKVLSQMSKGAS